MSTPSGKPFDPFDISAYAPKRSRQRPLADGQQDEEPAHDGIETGTSTSPFAMKREWPFAPTEAEEPASAQPQDVTSFGSEPPLDVPPADVGESYEEAETETAKQALDSDEEQDEQVESGAWRADPVGVADHVPDLARTRAAPALAAGEDDIEQIESGLRWLRREGDAGRLPRAAQLPPVRGLAPTRTPARRGDTYINGFRLPRSLEPEFVPPPMRARRDHLRGPIRILIASVIAAPIAYYFTTTGLWTESLPQRGAKSAAVETHVPALAPATAAAPSRESGEVFTPRGETIGMLPPVVNRDTPAAPEPSPTLEPARPKEAMSPARAPVAPRQEIASIAPEAVPAKEPARARDAPRAAPAPEQVGARAQPTRRLDPENIKLLVQQGEQFVAAGDLVTARVVFERAAEAGDPMAALAMGATYDPIVLAKLGVRGIEADIEKARGWYQKARDFGSPEAPRRLELLANR